MSWLSKTTGIGISKHGIKIDPIQAGLTALAVGTGGLSSPAAAARAAAKVAIPKMINNIPQVMRNGQPINIGDMQEDPVNSNPNPNGGGIIDRITGAVKDVRKATGGKAITLKNTLGKPVRDAMGGNAITLGNVIRNPIGALKGGVSSLLQNPEYALAGAAGVNAATAYKRAGDYRNKGIALAEKSYSDRAPLRTTGVSGMNNTQRVDTSQLIQDPSNPFARKRKMLLPNTQSF
jgi:hypothetical protein